MDYNIGDIVRTKKPHPCGSKLWEITRVGVDFKLKCQGCGHIVMVPREKALKMITKKIEDKWTSGDVVNLVEKFFNQINNVPTGS